jgi:hypothetical protein
VGAVDHDPRGGLEVGDERTIAELLKVEVLALRGVRLHAAERLHELVPDDEGVRLDVDQGDQDLGLLAALVGHVEGHERVAFGDQDRVLGGSRQQARLQPGEVDGGRREDGERVGGGDVEG